jgi:hypothetical protein
MTMIEGIIAATILQISLSIDIDAIPGGEEFRNFLCLIPRPS